ncbi:hypothetical protein [Nocardiopsis alkaliphila]|uniref:hypothetical protein n=1 Tax=Nocardiopsis alkaliphila TaxID=225762 RepID=UPI00126828B3|nr:hypothetical protein [Nocardiopsis alkaliphila]
MPNPSALLCLMLRVLRPCKGTHTTAFGYFREPAFELRRNRSRRVRRYAPVPLPTANTRTRPTSPVPSPRRPIDDLPHTLPPTHGRKVSVDLVRGYYLVQEEHRRTEALRRMRGSHFGSIVVEGVA